MSKRPSTSIARKAQAKAEADFATWLMMAKLGSFDDLPANARQWLEGYRDRLERMPESGAMVATIREIYATYYAEMGGDGDAPELAANVPQGGATVVDLKDVRRAKAARAVAESSTPRRAMPAVNPWLVFAAMVAAIAAIKFAFGS